MATTLRGCTTYCSHETQGGRATRADLSILCLVLQCALCAVRHCAVHNRSEASATCSPSMPRQTMRRRFARTAVGKSLFALTMAARLGPSSSSSSPLSSGPSLRPLFVIPATSTRAPRRLAATQPHASAAKPPPTRARRRARPAWHGCSSEAPAPTGGCPNSRAQGFSSSTRSGTRSPGKTFLAASNNGALSTGEDSPPGEPGRSVSPSAPPLTHEQLPEESIYLLDGTSMLFRAFYGRGAGGYLAPNGATEVGAVLAMGIEFAQFINEVKPRYVAMAFDVERETTFRRKMFPAYKAQRKPVPVDLTLQIPLAKALSEALGCKTFAMEGYEADDIMATLTRWGRSAGLGVVVCSSDKDMCQLVRERVHVMQPRSTGYAILGDEEVRAKFGVRSSSLPDLFGLVGDAADNIPGVKGIGPKGGSHLLQKFGTLEGVFAGRESVSTMEIRGAKGLQALLSLPDTQQEAFLYRDIATLRDEVPLDGIDTLTSSYFMYRGVCPEAEGVMRALGFTAPLRMIQEGLTRPLAPAVDIGPGA